MMQPMNESIELVGEKINCIECKYFRKMTIMMS